MDGIAVINYAPLLQLPDELLNEIITLLPISSRVIFRAVCRALWDHYERQPFCLWHHLHLKNYSIDRFVSMMGKSRLRRRIICKYTRHISCDFASACSATLVRTFITGQWHCIESIDFNNINDCTPQFIELLTNQRKSLKSIRLSKGDILSSGHFGVIFSICPELEQFHYIGGRGASELNLKTGDLILSQSYHLTSFHLDFDFDVEIVYISQILQHCPDLVDLVLVSDSDHNDRQLLEVIHTFCPRLTNFKYWRRRGTVRRGKRNQVQFSSKDLQFHVRTRSDMVEENLFLVPWIKKAHKTINNLSASICLLKPHQESLQELASVQYPQLHVLNLHCICGDYSQQNTPAHLSAVLQACPALEELRLLDLDTITDTVLKTIGELDHLYRLEISLGEQSAVTSQGIRLLFEATTSLEAVTFGGCAPYFTNECLYEVGQYKRLTEFSVTCQASQLDNAGVHTFVNLIRDTDMKHLCLSRLPDLSDETILAFAHLHALRYLEIGVDSRGHQSHIFDQLFEERTSDHPLDVNYLNADISQYMSSAQEYFI